MKALIIIVSLIVSLLVASTSMSRPISYVGGHTLMANSGAQSDNIYWHYTPNIKYSLGLDYQKDKISGEAFPSARLTYLINRKNTATSQRNLYALGSIVETTTFIPSVVTGRLGACSAVSLPNRSQALAMTFLSRE